MDFSLASLTEKAGYAFTVAVATSVAYILYRRFTRISIAHIPGPKSPSWWLGHARSFLDPECGVTEANWQKEFGAVVRYKGGVGEDRLYIADPKVLQHILQKSGYNYKNLSGDNGAKVLRAGRGLFWAEGELHKLYRKATAGHPEALAFLPVFHSTIERVADKWLAAIATDPSGKSVVVDMNDWMGKAALDVIGRTAFDYDFGAIDDVPNPLRDSYDARSSSIFGMPSYPRLLWEAIHNDVPVWLLDIIHKNMPGDDNKELRRNMAYMNKVISKVVKEQKAEMIAGDRAHWEEKRDMMSLLLKSTLWGDRVFTDREVVEQTISTVFGGHGTVALSMSWTLYEIAKRPEVQARMRAEILEMKAKVDARGDAHFNALDLEGLHYCEAVIRECFRLQSIIVSIRREAVKDDILPLHKPIVTTDGKVITELPIAKGTRLYLSVPGYHINENVFGEDTNEFKPERWLVDNGQTGLFGNILIFSTGIRSCPGRKFSVVEMLAFFVALLSKFEFAMPENSKRIIRHRTFAMVPMVEGELERGPQLPMKVTAISV